MRSSFVAFRARVYSRALSKGCCAGSRFRGCRATFEPGVCCDAAGRDSTLTFCRVVSMGLEERGQRSIMYHIERQGPGIWKSSVVLDELCVKSGGSKLLLGGGEHSKKIQGNSKSHWAGIAATLYP